MAAMAALGAALLLPLCLAFRPPGVRDILASRSCLLNLLGLGVLVFVLGVRLEYHPMTRYRPAFMANSGVYFAFLGLSLAWFSAMGLWHTSTRRGLRLLAGWSVGLFLLLSGLYLDAGVELLGEFHFFHDAKAESGVIGLGTASALWALVGWLSAPAMHPRRCSS